MDQQIPQQLQDKLAQFQNLQNQMQMITMQKQQLFIQSADIDNALGALAKSVAGEKIYKAAGPLLIETNKDESEKRLKEGKELAETRVKMLEKQEKKMSEKLDELKAEIQGMLKPMGGTGAI